MTARMVHFSKLSLPGNACPEDYTQETISILRERLLDSQQRGVRAHPSVYFGIWHLAPGIGGILTVARAAHVFDTSVDAIITDLLACLTVAKYVWRSPHATNKDVVWMCANAKEVLRHLCVLRTDHSVTGKRTESLRLVLIIVLSRAVTRDAWRSSVPNMRRLKCALQGVDVNRGVTESSAASHVAPLVC
ncbi:uncharacterized protein HMPREF1541_05302 [Cyphellophora europaea CBS 101466]|uniref:Uncharacterized protein n=1 Tax=Cyphellophora europaea (strain CBS 101466) TaxID=1220924 RepID=W2RRZ2_CYPE1|nr:uncharacterized protein HMPREF1541_05302 [Cyphellophora europaea CBS 101466]ETN39080.1 hypothetical protein HMPREF1541_05302 [Cyphellophora europaea CBS 101466]